MIFVEQEMGHMIPNQVVITVYNGDQYVLFIAGLQVISTLKIKELPSHEPELHVINKLLTYRRA